MSYWFIHKDKSGNTQVVAIDLLPIAIPLLVGIIVAIIAPNLLLNPVPFFYLSCVTTGIGFILFSASKVSVFSKGLLLTFGTKAMRKPFRVCYYLGYALIILGAVGVLITMLVYGGK